MNNCNILKKNKFKYFITYTISFLFLFFVCFGIYFYKSKKSFFRYADGLDQHYLIFLYIGKWLRECFKGIFINHTGIPLWNHGIGYGADILTSNGAYLPDLFNWISFFIPSKFSELGYNFMIVLKFYIAGLAFSYYGFYKKRPGWAVLVGSIIYTFSGTMYVAFIESFFINPMYIFPFIMVGVDKLLKENKPILYVVSLAYMFINYFYFAYMTCIAIFVYCILSFIIDKEIDKNFKSFLEILKKFILYSLLAIGISAFVLIPILLVLTQASRLGLEYYLPKLYSFDYYSGIISGLITYFSMSGRDCFIGYGAILIPCLILLFLKRGKYIKLKLEFILATIVLLVPVLGSIFNGMSYYSNRWIWIYALIVSDIVMVMITEFRELTNKQKYLMLFLLCVYVILSEIVFKNIYNIVFNIVLITVFICFNFFVISYNIKDKYYKICCICLACISVIIPSYFYYSAKNGNGTIDEVERGTALNSFFENTGMSILNEIDFSDGSRYDEYGIGRVRNTSWLYGVSGMDFYISIYNNNIDKFHNDIGLLTSPWTMGYSGLDRKSELEALMGVNHYLINSDNRINLPYNYSELEYTKNINGINYESYKPKQDYQIIYGFDKSIGYSEFKKLSIFDRNQAIMNAIVVDDEKSNSSLEDFQFNNDEVSYKIENSNVELFNNNGKISVNNTINEGAEFNLKFDNYINNSELWVYLEGMNYNFEEESIYNISISGYNNDKYIDNIHTDIMRMNSKNHMYGGKNTVLLNLGYITEDINNLKIKLLNLGEYTFKDIKVFARKQEEIYNSINGLNKIAKDITLSKNKINFKTDLDKKQYVFISIPYSSGWKAKVNGKNVNILKADDAFMALELDKGKYNIEFTYRTPGLGIGFIISLSSIIISIIVIKKKVFINISNSKN